MTSDNFDVVATYQQLLIEDPELTMPVAAIESLILALGATPASTMSETLHLVQTCTAELKKSIRNPISLSAGTDLFQQYLISNLQQRPSEGDFDVIRKHLVENGRLFVERAKAARETIAGFGRHFIRDGNVVLTNGGSRVVGALLRSAAESSKSSKTPGGSIRFKVIYVVSSDDSNYTSSEAAENIRALRERDVPVAVIQPSAVAYCMDQVTQVFVGAEGVVENGGVVNRMGTYQMAMIARATRKPFYVVSESHKFVRLYPLGQKDLGIEQDVLIFETASGPEVEDGKSESGIDEGIVADVDEVKERERRGDMALARLSREEAIDYTPPDLISGIITESGVLLPSAVSEELIKIWF
ncbi:translation initiation factor eIF-2B subunit alpha [Polychaeton citri CBS 116435]|uniref:Translation initiation factor eIF2B subunit alpha n=1 Tax=Polychaeton citri CBS 116435 TaxID=1314669 RepID=A0A9P4USI8_9PEZI|nr:translation initiation factor eIF-2B subunit alpha [Polychaeton citri CBS 116435]